MNIVPHGRYRTTGRFFRREARSPHRPAALATLRARSGNRPRRRLRRSPRARSPRHRRRPRRRAQRPRTARGRPRPPGGNPPRPAARAGNALGLILRTAPDDGPSAAATRWIVGAAPSLDAERGHGVGPPRLFARLVRNRRGHLGAWIVEWNSVEQRFELATHSEPVAGSAFDRPHRTAVA